MPPGPPWGAAVGFGQVSHGLNLLRPHLAGPQHYQPPPPVSNQEEDAADASSESSDAGGGSPKSPIKTSRPLMCKYLFFNDCKYVT